MELPVGMVKELIGPKKPRLAEIELTLFENCDVNCAFCGHDKKSVVGLSLEEMLSKLPLIAQFLDKMDKDISMVNLHLVGGELLQDRLITSERNILNDYQILINEYQKLCLERSIEPRIIIVSNMLTTKRELIKEWFKEMNKAVYMRFIASYDLYGRPITKQYLENILFFKDYISNINVVVTKEAIQKLHQGDAIFDQLYEQFPIFMDDFLPDSWTQHMIPSDEEYLSYLHLIASKYPKLMPFGEAMAKVKTSQLNEIQFTTFNKCNILPNNMVTNYLWDRHNPENFVGKVNYEDNSNMLFQFLESNQCLVCEYYVSCPLRCPVSWSWKDRERSSGCVNKRFFDSIFKLQV